MLCRCVLNMTSTKPPAKVAASTDSCRHDPFQLKSCCIVAFGQCLLCFQVSGYECCLNVHANSCQAIPVELHSHHGDETPVVDFDVQLRQEVNIAIFWHVSAICCLSHVRTNFIHTVDVHDSQPACFKRSR